MIGISKVTNGFATLDNKPIKNKMKVQNWLDNSENKYEESYYVNKMIYSWKLKNLQENVKNFKLPNVETINSWSLKMTVAYEAMLVEIVDKLPSNLTLAVEILLHLKIIENNQIHKFKIFE